MPPSNRLRMIRFNSLWRRSADDPYGMDAEVENGGEVMPEAVIVPPGKPEANAVRQAESRRRRA